MKLWLELYGHVLATMAFLASLTLLKKTRSGQKSGHKSEVSS
jgi:hypothetical protein